MPNASYVVQIQPGTTVTAGGWSSNTNCVYFSITSKTTVSFMATLRRCNNSNAVDVTTTTPVDWIATSASN
jgi:hypothetical protein